MSVKTIAERVHNFLQEESPLTHAEIVKKFAEDKSKVSGYLEAMVDRGEISMKKVGKGKVYLLSEKGK